MSRYRFTLLMAAFLCVLVVYPFLDYFQLAQIDFALNIFITLLLISCIHALSASHHQAIVSSLVIIPAIFMDWVGVFVDNRTLEIYIDLYQIGAFSYICIGLLKYALQAGVVDREKIAAAVNVYLFLGLIWRDLYSLTNILIPGAFNSELLAETDFLYYSFVTLSTLGYGDVLPVIGPSKALAYIEAIIGQLYLTILVARLVGLHIAYTGPECQDGD
ncbi:MAG: potassium channel family protein [Desulfobacterales bacterium]|nr:potassium channel family protein [Desulfobacterales bacterium]MDJ0887626.1 potassium channel family protein [Desulfobacterales bacterium]MDJ0991134.1 potassium channel family protein [Desulfobacterales bacterium]